MKWGKRSAKYYSMASIYYKHVDTSILKTYYILYQPLLKIK